MKQPLIVGRLQKEDVTHLLVNQIHCYGVSRAAQAALSLARQVNRSRSCICELLLGPRDEWKYSFSRRKAIMLRSRNCVLISGWIFEMTCLNRQSHRTFSGASWLSIYWKRAEKIQKEHCSKNCKEIEAVFLEKPHFIMQVRNKDVPRKPTNDGVWEKCIVVVYCHFNNRWAGRGEFLQSVRLLPFCCSCAYSLDCLQASRRFTHTIYEQGLPIEGPVLLTSIAPQNRMM